MVKKEFVLNAFPFT